jgi:energy-coupling factor transporter ATP-binding protein EcfA2
MSYELTDMPSNPQILKLTASGARRQGDEYQDVQALDTLVAWLENNGLYQWVKLEADESGFLDDILAMREDGVLEVRQVKYSTTSHAADDTWTWEMLLKQRKGKKGPLPSLIQKWFGTWREYVDNGSSISPSLVSNRRAAKELTLDASRTGKVNWGELADDKKNAILSQLGDESEVASFFQVFDFRLSEPSLRELEGAVRIRFARLAGTTSGRYALEMAVREWINTKDNPPPKGRISLEHVRSIAKLKPYPVGLRRFLPPVTFFEPYLDHSRLFHHCLPHVGRRAQLKDLLSFVSGENRVLILPGRGGSGKSKLIHALCRLLARQHPDLNVRLAVENLPIKEAALQELPDDNGLIIVDDAHRTDGLEVLLAAAVQNTKLKVLLVTRPHATDYLMMQVINAGFDRSNTIISRQLPELNYLQHQRRLARLALGRDWASYADELAFATRDSPLLTVLGGQLLRTEQVPPASLTQNEKFRQEILTRFRDITFGRIISQLDGRFTPEMCANLLPFIAALTPFDLEHEVLVQTVARLLETDQVKLKQLIGSLVKGGALVRGGRLVRIVPDVLSDFILQDACFAPDGVPTGWANQLYQAVADFSLDTVLRNLAELDWRVRTPGVVDSSTSLPAVAGAELLDSIWLDIENRFRASTLSERKAWLTRLERVAFIQASRMWPLIEIARNELAPEKPDEISTTLRRYLRPTTQVDVLAATVPILRTVAHHDLFTGRCADLLWEMGRDIEPKPNHSPSAIQALRELSSVEYDKSLTFSHIILTRCCEWMIDPNIYNYHQSILKVISPMLARQHNWTGSDKRWHVSGAFPLPSEPYKDLRHGALKLVERCAFSPRRTIILEALETLKAPISEEGLWGLEKDDPAEWHKWEEEQLEAIDIVERVVKTNDDPFVRLRIWELLHRQAAKGRRPAVKQRARELLKAIPLSFESRLILLMTDKYIREEYDGAWEDFDQERVATKTQSYVDLRGSQKNVDFAGQVTREFSELYPDARAGFEAFDTWIERVETSGWWSGLWTRSNSFLLQLASDYPQYARAWCVIAPEEPESRTTGKCDDLLCELRRQDQKDALGLAQGFLAKNHPNLWLRVAESYSWRCWPQEPLPEESQLVRDLLAFPNSRVKRTAAQIVSGFAATDVRRALDLILGTDIGEDSELADNLFEVFEDRRGFDFTTLTSDELARLLEKLSGLNSIRTYHLGRFLLQAALREPIIVAKFLLDRVRRKVTLNNERLETRVDDSLTVEDLADKFGGLPESGFHDQKFQEVANHQNFKDALRVIRDAAASKAYSSGLLFEDTLSELFHDFSLNYSSASLEVLDEWINSGECTKVRAAMILLEDTYLGFYLNNQTFVSNYLQRAKKCGADVFEEVEHAMLHSAEFGPPRAATPIRGQRSNALFHKASDVLRTVQSDSLIFRFFQKLREKGQERIRSEMREAATEEVFFRS